MTRPLRFVLDHNIDVAIRSVFHARDIYWVHSVQELGMVDATPDETIAVIADEHDAVVITSDREYSSWRRRRLVGRHIFMRCQDPEVTAVMDAHLDSIIGILKHKNDAYIRLSRDGFTTQFAWDP